MPKQIYTLTPEQHAQIVGALTGAWGCLDAGVIQTMRNVETALTLLRNLEPVEPCGFVYREMHLRTPDSTDVDYSYHGAIHPKLHFPLGTPLYAAKETP